MHNRKALDKIAAFYTTCTKLQCGARKPASPRCQKTYKSSRVGWLSFSIAVRSKIW
ncbi:hypothetical protein F511_10279 [Dorcoceras hygrometricum]|uniref:Uncharacterized protein n=1 Tax=Dorcoceras hygrometricum TaxID=472368 RepID=A0A2Z7C2K0_9LAMI|nr:hypothetical protein F511_10279 [Dorcoceras hygrometricum]